MNLNLNKTRARYLGVVYVEPGRIEYLHCRYVGGSWRVQSTSAIDFSGKGPVFERLKQLEVAPGNKADTDLILIPSKAYYSFFKERYPTALGNKLDKVIQFDWAENLFFEDDELRHFHGAPFAAGNFHHVPMFSMDGETFDMFRAALDGDAYRRFIVMPSSLAYASLAEEFAGDGEPLLMGRLIGNSRLELHRIVDGSVLDSIEVRPNGQSLTLFRYALENMHDEFNRPSLHLFVSAKERKVADDEVEDKDWLRNAGFAVKEHRLQTPVVASLTEHLIHQDMQSGFTGSHRINPLKIPKSAWAVALLLVVFASAAYYLNLQRTLQQEELLAYDAEYSALQSQWEPLRDRRERREKERELEAVLSGYGRQAIPIFDLVELLTVVTPDDTWINQVNLSMDGSINLTLQGLSDSAMRYQPMLADIPGFNDVQFVSSVRRDQRTNKDRFVLRMDLNPEELLPEMQARGIGVE